MSTPSSGPEDTAPGSVGRQARTINLGWDNGTLMKQTGVQSKEMKRLELIRHSITVLRLHGYLPQSASNKMREKLLREIRAALQQASQSSSENTSET
jgi:hypothetical protein